MGLLFIPVLWRAWYIGAQPSEYWLNVLARDVSALRKFPAWHWPCPFHLKCCHWATWTRALATSVGGLINSPWNNQASPTPSLSPSSLLVHVHLCSTRKGLLRSDILRLPRLTLQKCLLESCLQAWGPTLALSLCGWVSFSSHLTSLSRHWACLLQTEPRRGRFCFVVTDVSGGWTGTLSDQA